jgi:L-threonylcarbamoyladenylate synthase
MQNDWIKAKEVLMNDGVVVLPTDTLYGLVASAWSKRAVEKIYEIKERDKSKALIVLIYSLTDLEKFGIKPGKKQTKILAKIWPGEVSVLLACKSAKFKYIHRGTKEIAFRMIGRNNIDLCNLIKKVGPIVAPSANIESFAPSETIKEAKLCFGDKVDLYISDGRRKGDPSTLIRIKDSSLEILRQGNVRIK